MISIHSEGLTDEVVNCVGCESSPCCRYMIVELVEEDLNSNFPYKTTDYMTLLMLGGYPPSFMEACEYIGIPFLDVGYDGYCTYFKDGRCSIYENRPYVCRVFNCGKGTNLDTKWQWLQKMEAEEKSQAAG